MKLCTFILPDSSRCPQPALKRSPAQLCRHHAGLPQRHTMKAQAAAEAARLPLRRALRAEHELRLRLDAAAQHFRAQQIRLHPLPDFDSLPNLNLALDHILHLHAVGVFDARTARIMLTALRICFVSFQLGYSDPAAAAFRTRLRQAKRALQKPVPSLRDSLIQRPLPASYLAGYGDAVRASADWIPSVPFCVLCGSRGFRVIPSASPAPSAVSIGFSSASISVHQRPQSLSSLFPLPSSPDALQFAPLYVPFPRLRRGKQNASDGASQ